MKKNVFIAVGVLTVIVIGVLFFLNDTGEKQAVIRIGAILPLTGDAAVAGHNTKKGIDLAVNEINRRGGINGLNLRVIYEDTKAVPKTGVNATKKLIDRDKVCYIIDNSISAVTLAVAPLFKNRDCVLLSTGASSPEITNAGENIYRIWNSDYEEASAMADFVVREFEGKKLLVLYTNTEYGIGLKNAFMGTFSSKDNVDESVLGEDGGIPQNVFGRISQYDAIYLVAYSRQSAYATKQLIENGFAGVFLGTSVMLDLNVQEEFMRIQNDLYYPSPKTQDEGNLSYANFVKEYETTYGTKPVPLSDVGYDAVMIFCHALSEKSDRTTTYEKIKSYFETQVFEGASGIMQFDANGDVHKEIVINKLEK